jgi:hypothetical protein
VASYLWVDFPGSAQSGPGRTIGSMTRIRVLVIGGLAWSGVVLGHLVAYLLAYPAEAERATRLADTGHGSFPLLLVSALAAIPGILSLLAVRVMRGDRSPSLFSTAVWLAAIQVPAFLAMEFFERGLSLEQMVLEPAVLVGLVIQVLVAVISAVLVKTFVRAVVALTSRLRRLPRQAPARLLAPAMGHRPKRLVFLTSARRRAPPLTSVS